MKIVYLLGVLMFLGMTTGMPARAQGSEVAASVSSMPAGVPLDQLVGVMARKTGKRFVLDPRAHANVVLIGTSAAELTYPDFLTVLYVYGLAAVEDGKLVAIVPDANVRQQALPTITAKDTRPGSEYVCEVLNEKNVSAAQLIPILRPMVVQPGHMASYPENNALILCDRFENVRRLEGIIHLIAAAEGAKPRASAPSPETTPR